MSYRVIQERIAENVCDGCGAVQKERVSFDGWSYFEVHHRVSESSCPKLPLSGGYELCPTCTENIFAPLAQKRYKNQRT